MTTPRTRPSALRVLAAVFGAALGLAAFVAGGLDDSPGLQLIGVCIVAGAMGFALSGRRSDHRSTVPGQD